MRMWVLTVLGKTGSWSAILGAVRLAGR